MSSLYTDSEESLAGIAIEWRGSDQLSVMIGGLGLGYTASATLRSECVATVEVVELLPQVIGWLADGLVPLSADLNADSRLQVVQDDVYARLAAAPKKRYDLILIDVDHSPDERLGGDSVSFYTHDGLIAAKQHLNKDGVLAVWSYAESSPFADALRDVFDEVRVEPVTYENQLVNEQVTDWLFFAR